jgi:hypothetical protein
MTYSIDTTYDFRQFNRGSFSREAFPHAVSGAVALTLSILVGAGVLYIHSATMNAPAFPSAEALPPVPPVAVRASPEAYGSLAAAPPPPANVDAAAAGTPAEIRSSDGYVALLDPTYSLGGSPASLAQSAPLRPAFQSNPYGRPATMAEGVRPAPMPPVADQLVQNVPLPAPRPAELQVASSHGAHRTPGPQLAEQNTTIPPATPDHPSFFQKLFGMAHFGGTELAYASPEDGIANDEQKSVAVPMPYDHQTAVYDISAHVVYLPDGTRLEAHSGLGDALDDPRYVSERMRGPTPPGVYDLQPREQPFHGVQALRLIPVGNSDTYGRAGLLAHTFMLGQNGDSFGCVSFRDYQAFLRAYESGEVKRLTVVARLN